jgi:hypothetical protein
MHLPEDYPSFYQRITQTGGQINVDAIVVGDRKSVRSDGRSEIFRGLALAVAEIPTAGGRDEIQTAQED